MPRVPRGGCGTSATASGLDYAWVGSDVYTIASAAWPTYTQIFFGAGAPDHGTFMTNAPTTFVQHHEGIKVLRGGYYQATYFGLLERAVAIAVGTKRGGLQVHYPAPFSSIDSFEAVVVNPALNCSSTGAAAGDSPQSWDMVQFVATNIPMTFPAFPAGPFSMFLAQESGGAADGTGEIYIERIADGIA